MDEEMEEDEEEVEEDEEEVEEEVEEVQRLVEVVWGENEVSIVLEDAVENR